MYRFINVALSKYSLAVVAVSLAFLPGCQRSAADPLTLSIQLSSAFEQQLSHHSQSFKAIDILHGMLTATRTSDGRVFTFDWSLSLDDETWEVQSNKTIVLEPGPYQFTLVFGNAPHQYFAEGAADIDDGQNTVSLTLAPVLGDLVVDPTLREVAALRFQYPANQLAALADPRIGVSVDGEDEQIIDFNPATGITDVYVLLAEGERTISLSLYDGAMQRGRSVAEQESVTVVLGQDIHMDLVPLHGETVFEISSGGGDLDIEIEIPREVVEEAGGLANLEGLFSLIGPRNALIEVPLTLVSVGDDYGANLALSDINYDTVTYSLTFNDNSVMPKELIANCSGTVVLDQTSRSVTCDLQLRRRAVVGGNIFAVVGVNVFDTEWEALAGAVVANGNQPVGITGSGSFGTDGYLRLYLLPGTHLLTALDLAGDGVEHRFGQASVTVDSLDVVNVDIIVDRSTTTCAETAECPAPQFTPTDPVCPTVPGDICATASTWAGIWTSHECTAGGCIPYEMPGSDSCPLDPEGAMCAPPEVTSTRCSYTNFCDETATRVVTTTLHTCQSDGCGSTTITETLDCTRRRDGLSCNGGNGTCQNDTCEPNWVPPPVGCDCPPFHRCCEPGRCAAPGTQCP